jgi:hypothetical protein
MRGSAFSGKTGGNVNQGETKHFIVGKHKLRQ